MATVSFAGRLCLSLAISTQFALEICVTTRSCEKFTKIPYFEGSRSFKVIDVDILKKLVASACYDKQHVCAYICNHFHARRASSSKITYFRGCPSFSFSFVGALSPSGMKLCHEILKTLHYHTVKTQSRYLTWAWISTGSWQTAGQTELP